MITSEYPTVLKRSSCRSLLERVHGISITEAAARQLIFTYLDEDEIENDIRFTGKTGPGCCEYKNKYHRRVDIRLPSENSGLLTLGMTLHEIAHGLNYIDFDEKGHGDSFITVLDNLVMSEWYSKEEQLNEDNQIERR